MNPIAYILVISSILYQFSALAESRQLNSSLFQDCTQMLTKNVNLTPYAVAPLKALSDNDFIFLKNLFRKYGGETEVRESLPDPSGRTLRYNNPFVLYVLIDEKGQISPDPRYSAWDTEFEEFERAELLRILKLMFERTIDEAKSNPILRLSSEIQGTRSVNLFGLRYFLQPGFTPALKFHRDSVASIQSLFEVERPANLVGGTTVVAWPNQERDDLNNRAPVEIMERIWEPNAKPQHLIVLDSRHAFHGTSSFFLPEGHEPTFRDVLGLTIDSVK